MLESRECYGCGETGHIRRNCPKPSYRPPIIRVRGGQGRGRHSGGRGVRGNGGNQNGRGNGKTGTTVAQHGRGNGQTADRAHCYAFPGRSEAETSDAVITGNFWFVIAWLLYCLILDPHFHMYLPYLLLVLIYIVNFLTCLFVFLLRWVSL